MRYETDGREAAVDENGNGTTNRDAVGAGELARRVRRLVDVDRPRYARLWAYYRNPMLARAVSAGQESDRPYRQAQEWGLPARLTGVRAGTEVSSVMGNATGEEVTRKEVVIENDIGWRVDTMVDYLFGKPLVITSAAPDQNRRRQIGQLLRAILAHNGGTQFLQQLALLGAVHGFVDVLVKLDTTIPFPDIQADYAPVEQEPVVEPDAHSSGLRELGEPPAPMEGRAQNEANSTDLNSDEPSLSGPAPRVEAQASPAQGSEAAVTHLPSADDARLGSSTDTGASNTTSLEAHLLRLARMIRLEIVEPARALPFLSPTDCRVVQAYGQSWELAVGSGQLAERNQMAVGPGAPGLADDGRASLPTANRQLPTPLRWWQRLRRAGVELFAPRESVRVVEIITPSHWQRYEDQRLVAEGDNSLGEIPLVHIQNTAVPFEYSGASDVEPLIPLQDELNTRLSDRANRVAMQSFKMYLGKRVPDFLTLPVAPGRMWVTDDPSADVVEFGGDANCPSEDAHINEVREALDKTSGVCPIAAGAIKNRIGRLTSAAALRVTLMALLAKTDRKRTAYGLAIERMCELALGWLDRAGVFRTKPEERRIEIHWPSPLPENDLEKLQEAAAKARLGVPREVVLRELGY